MFILTTNSIPMLSTNTGKTPQNKCLQLTYPLKFIYRRLLICLPLPLLLEAAYPTHLQVLQSHLTLYL